MKTVYAILLIMFLQNIFAAYQTKAQTVAIGHVSCEIVESVSVASEAVTGFSIETKNNDKVAAETVSLGNIKVNSGTGVAYNVVMNSATLSSSNGSSFKIEPAAMANNSKITESQNANGDQTLRLTGQAYLAQGQQSGVYQGSYSVVLAYN